MNVIPALAITDAMLTYSSVSEPDAGSPSTEPIYDAGVSYALAAVVISTTTHRKYESLAAANLGNALTNTTKWLDIGPTNKWAMFDILRNTQTIAPSPIVVTIVPGERINSIAVLGLDATSVTVMMTGPGSPAPLYYTHTEDLNTREVLNWYDYFFEPFSTRPAFALFDLPPYSNGIITVTITNTVGDAKCGAIAIGTFQYIGEAQQEAESEELNFSTITRETTGEAVLVQRRSLPKSTQRVLCDKSLVNQVRELRTALNATPAVWSALDDQSTHEFFDALLILGIYRQFRITLADPTCTINLEVEEI